MTRERLRQIGLNALKKLRHSSRRRPLEAFATVTPAPKLSPYNSEISIDDGC
ncbi:MAG: hypothetical protein ACRERE_10425 [Candidatus Entotheonellia bacterium]